MIDAILEKIKLTKGKSINSNLLINILAQTENYSEVKYIIYQLDYCKIKMSIRMYDSELKFIENYKDAREIFKYFSNVKLNTNNLKLHHSLRYLYLIQTTDTLQEVEEVFKEMKFNNVKPAMGCYVELLKKQVNYEKSREMFEKYILLPQPERIESWKTKNTSDALKNVYGILYLKARADYELEQIRNDLKNANMSTDIKDYNYLKGKSSTIRIREFKKIICSSNTTEEALIDYIYEKNYNCSKNYEDINYSNSKKVKRTYNVYERNKKLVEKIKILYDNTCQICGERLDLGIGYYSEVHHLYPLHLKGPDILENMMVLCPNHHILFDRGAISIYIDKNIVIYSNGKEERIKFIKHSISNECVDFNNKNIFRRMETNSIKQINEYDEVNYGSKIVIMKSDTKEEFLITISNTKEELTYLEFMLLKHRIGEKISINNEPYFILNID